MKIKFLQQTPSSNPAYPFEAGQIIDVEWDKDVRYWVSSGLAVQLEDTADVPEETAVLGEPPEKAVVKRAKPKARGKR